LTRTIEYRVARLERCLLNFLASVSGEAAAEGTPEEVAALQEVFGTDLQDIANELTGKV
jgi:hypothetical protein